MTAAATQIAAARALLAAFVDGGAGDLVASPGSRNTPVLLAAHGLEPRLRVHVVLDERTAAFMALGLARSSGRPTLLCCTSGSAPGSYLPALLEAEHSGLPVVALSADRPPELHGCGAAQATDQARLFGPHVRLFLDLGVPAEETAVHRMGAVAARARAAATAPPAGPVHLNLPFRKPLWAQGADLGVAASPGPPPMLPAAPARPEGRHLDRLADILASASRGVLLCGPRGDLAAGPADRLPEAVARVGAALGWPILAHAASGLRFGPWARELIATAAPLEASPDRIVHVGGLHPNQDLAAWLRARGRGRVLTVDPGGRWTDPDHLADLRVMADPAALLHGLADRLEGLSSATEAGWLDLWTGHEARREGRRAKLLDAGSEDGSPLDGERVARKLAGLLPEGSLLHAGNSLSIRDLDAAAPVREARIAVSCNRGLNGIDGTVSTALGAALAWSSGPAAALLGDLSLLHDVSGVLACADREVDLTVVVSNNGGGAIFDALPIAGHPTAFERFFRTPRPVGIRSICGAAGLRWYEARSPAELRAALAEEIGRPGVGLVEARTAPASATPFTR